MAVVLMLSAAIAAPQFPPVADLPARDGLPSWREFFDGRSVESPEQFIQERRPELKALFEHYMYGVAPAAPGITARIESEHSDALGGKATLRQVEISFNGLPQDAPKIHLALFIPNEAPKPAPVFLAVNKCGNKGVVADERVIWNENVYINDPCPEDGARGAETDFWCVDYLLSRGYAFATFHESDIDPDKHDFTDGVHAQYPDLQGPSRWGTIRAWAWGLHRCVDYLVTDKDIDAKRICVTGHSRRGKTALLAAAFDERVALCVPHQSGTGGTALSRENDQETIERINRVFPHWFNDLFPEFNDKEETLPIDQHLLIALVAPRPLLDTQGKQDQWANGKSAWRAIEAAGDVYEFLGSSKKPSRVEAAKITPENTAPLMQYWLDTKHTLNQDYWTAILDFADLQLSHKNSSS